MKPPLRGGCLCGAIRFECRADPITAVFCHCRACQKFHAAPYAACAMMPEGAIVVVSGDPARYEVVGDSGAIVFREFCGRCGTQLFSGSSGHPQSKTVKIASLDDPSAIHPSLICTPRSEFHGYALKTGSRAMCNE